MSNNCTYLSKLCFLKKLPAVLSSGKLCEDHGYTYHWTSGQKPHLIRNGKRIDCNPSNRVPFVFPGLSASSSSTTPSLLLRHLHHRIPYLMIQYQKEVEVRVKSFGETRCMNLQKTKTKIKMRNAKKYKEIHCMNCLIGYRNSERIWLMKVLQQSHGETQSKEVKTLLSHLMNFQWSREQN